MERVFEIHKYKIDTFLYIVARTNKHSEDYVKGDVEKMNNMLSPEMKAEGIRYVFALGTVDSMARKAGERTHKKSKRQDEENSPLVNS
jgi:hypothetical protein